MAKQRCKGALQVKAYGVTSKKTKKQQFTRRFALTKLIKNSSSRLTNVTNFNNFKTYLLYVDKQNNPRHETNEHTVTVDRNGHDLHKIAIKP